MIAGTRRRLLLALPLLALAYLGLCWLGNAGLRGLRVDLTEHRNYTLSEGTVRLLRGLPRPVSLELFYSERAARVQPPFRVYAQRVRELLEEMAARSDGRLRLVVTDPEPLGEDEDRAQQAGLAALPLGEGGDALYFGLVARGGEAQAAISFLQPDREALLEYEVARMVAGLATPRRPVLAWLSGLPTGPGVEPFTGRPTPGWAIDRQLSEAFDLRRLEQAPSAIDADVDLLVLVHPRGLPESTEAAVDQYVLRGGRLLVFVDPDAESQGEQSGGQPQSSDLPRLFAAWGLHFDPGKVVLDSRSALRVQPEGAAAVTDLAVLGVPPARMNPHDVVTAGLAPVNLSSAGALSLAADADARLEALLQSSPSAMLADAGRVHGSRADPASLVEGFAPDGGGPYVLAARLGGRLRTAFPQLAGPGRLARSVRPAHVVVVADSDLLTDAMWVQVQDFLGRPVGTAFAGNGDFVYNAADQLVGNEDLIGLRTRPSGNRPFERIEEVRRRAELRYQSRSRALEQKLAAVEQQLAQLRSVEAADGRPAVVDPARQAAILRQQQARAALRRELRDVQRGLDADIEAIGTRLKLLDILAMPALVLVLALLIAWRRRLRRQDVES